MGNGGSSPFGPETFESRALACMIAADNIALPPLHKRNEYEAAIWLKNHLKSKSEKLYLEAGKRRFSKSSRQKHI